MNRLVIADVKSMNINGKAVGHYYTVATNYLEMFKSKCEVKVAGGPLYIERYDKDLILLRYDTFEENPIKENKKRILSNIKLLFSENKNSSIVMQCSAVATAYLGIALYKPKSCNLYMIQYNTLGLDSPLKRILYYFAKGKIDGIICPQDKIGRAYARPYCMVPDYIYTETFARASVDWDDKTYDFGMLGIIARDKGVLEVARRLKNTKYRVLIAGYPQTPEIGNVIKSICSDARNIELKLQYLSEAEYKESIRNSRYCVLNYSGAYSEHSSGVVFDILFSGVPVVGRHCQSLRFIDEQQLGLVYDNIDTLDFDVLMDRESYSEYLVNIKKYYEQHESYRAKLAEFLRI